MSTASDRDFSPVLVALRASGLGDLLTAVPALKALRRAFPGYRRIVATPAWLTAVVDRVGGFAVAPTTGLDEPIPLWPGPEVAVNLHGRGPESHHRLLALRPRRLLAFGCAATGTDGPPWVEDEWEPARWCRLLDQAGIPADAGDLHLARPDPVPAGPAPTLVHPGAGAPARCWPPERFAAVARAERARGREVLVTGSHAEAPLARCVARLAELPPTAVVAGRTDLGALIDLVGAAGRVVCGDTGLAHLATALGTPSVVLFGPTPPARWGPPPGTERHRALWAGATGDPHGTAPFPGLLRIDVSDVIDALADLPDPRPDSARAC